MQVVHNGVMGGLHQNPRPSLFSSLCLGPWHCMPQGQLVTHGGLEGTGGGVGAGSAEAGGRRTFSSTFCTSLPTTITRCSNDDLSPDPDRELSRNWGALAGGVGLLGVVWASSRGRGPLPMARGGEGERPDGEVAPSIWWSGLPEGDRAIFLSCWLFFLGTARGGLAWGDWGGWGKEEGGKFHWAV